MWEALPPWHPQTRMSHSIEIDDLSISFMRTIRVPNNVVLNALTPSLGEFPLFNTEYFADKLPVSMAEKGGIFIPMYPSAYKELGSPFYHLYEEPSRVSGGFSGVGSVAQVDGTPEKALNLGNVGLLDPRGPKSELRFPWEFWELRPEKDTEV